MSVRYPGPDLAGDFVAGAQQAGQGMARLTIQPYWVDLPVFGTRWPSAWAR